MSWRMGYPLSLDRGRAHSIYCQECRETTRVEDTYIKAPVRSSVLEFVSLVAEWWMLQALPQSFSEEIRENSPGSGIGRQRGSYCDDLFHLLLLAWHFKQGRLFQLTAIFLSSIGLPAENATSSKVLISRRANFRPAPRMSWIMLVEACSGDEYAASTSNRVPGAGFAGAGFFFQGSNPPNLLGEEVGTGLERCAGGDAGFTTVPLAGATT